MLKTKKINRSLWGSILIFLLILILGIFMALPLVYTVINAFKPVNELFLFPPRFFIKNPTTDNFTQMFELAGNLWVPFYRYLFNSVFVTATGTTVYIIIASLAAYPLAKHKFPGSAIFFQIIVWAILFRPEVTGVPMYVILAKLQLVNTYFALILPALAGTFGVFLMRQFMTSFPDTVIEAAKIDGYNDFGIFLHVVMPNMKTAVITLVIFTFLSFWNTTGMNFIYDERLKLLPSVLSQISLGGVARAGAGSAVGLFLMIPPVILFVAGQSAVLETMTFSGIKE